MMTGYWGVTTLTEHCQNSQAFPKVQLLNYLLFIILLETALQKQGIISANLEIYSSIDKYWVTHITILLGSPDLDLDITLMTKVLSRASLVMKLWKQLLAVTWLVDMVCGCWLPIARWRYHWDTALQLTAYNLIRRALQQQQQPGWGHAHLCSITAAANRLRWSEWGGES